MNREWARDNCFKELIEPLSKVTDYAGWIFNKENGKPYEKPLSKSLMLIEMLQPEVWDLKLHNKLNKNKMECTREDIENNENIAMTDLEDEICRQLS